MLGYGNKEMLSLSVDDIHPPESMLHVLDAFRAMSERRLKSVRAIPCLRKDGGIVYADITAAHLIYQKQPCMFCFFHDVTEQRRAMELLAPSRSGIA